MNFDIYGVLGEINTIESRFLEPPKIGSRNRRWHEMMLICEVLILLSGKGNYAHFRTNRWEVTYLSLNV